MHDLIRDSFLSVLSQRIQVMLHSHINQLPQMKGAYHRLMVNCVTLFPWIEIASSHFLGLYFLLSLYLQFIQRLATRDSVGKWACCSSQWNETMTKCVWNIFQCQVELVSLIVSSRQRRVLLFSSASYSCYSLRSTYDIRQSVQWRQTHFQIHKVSCKTFRIPKKSGSNCIWHKF